MATYSPHSQTPGELEHYGVKGMKWGVRKDLERLSRIDKRLKKSVKKYKEKTSSARTFAQKNERSMKYSKRVDQNIIRAERFVMKNADLWKQNADEIGRSEYADLAKKWLTYMDSDEESRFWMTLAMYNET